MKFNRFSKISITQKLKPGHEGCVRDRGET